VQGILGRLSITFADHCTHSQMIRGYMVLLCKSPLPVPRCCCNSYTEPRLKNGRPFAPEHTAQGEVC